MAQLIKLRDYISRYEWDVYRYPSQYIRLKQENWKELYQLWEHNKFNLNDEDQAEEIVVKAPPLYDHQPKVEALDRNVDVLPATEMGLRQHFLDKLYPFQLKWATSTVTKVSFIGPSYYNDNKLKYFLQRFPDIYLMMYYPVFNIRNAPVDGEIIFISPVGIEIIYLLENSDTATILAGDDRTWAIEDGNLRSNIISPLIALKRMEQIIKSILQANKMEYNIKKVILSRTNNIVFSSKPYNTNIIGKYQYENWFQDKRKLSSPLKSQQLKVVEILLRHCLTNAVERPEWKEDTTPDGSDE